MQANSAGIDPDLLKHFPGFSDTPIILVNDDGDAVATQPAADGNEGSALDESFGSEDGFYEISEQESEPEVEEAPAATPRETPRAALSPTLDKIMTMDEANKAGAFKAKSSDPIFEATVTAFRETGFAISRDDETFAVMQFLYIAVKNIEDELKAERRVEHDDMLSRLITMREDVQALTERQSRTASIIETNLDQTLEHYQRVLLNLVATVVTATEKRIDENIKKAEGAADAAFENRFRLLVSDEVRIGLAKGMDTEMQLLRSSVVNASKALDAATKATAARARKGWIQNAVDDFSALGAQQKMAVGGGFAALLLAIVLF